MSTIRVVSYHETLVRAVPTEVISGDYRLAGLRAHFRDEAEGFEPVVDAKVMVLGNVGVGKTQFCRWLAGEEFQIHSDPTHGVAIVPVRLPRNGEEIALQMWDFGQQDIYHGTHALFMRENAIFALLWAKEFEGRGGDGDQPLRYWVDYVRHLGGRGRAVTIVQTRCDAPTDDDIFPVPEATIKQAFGRYALVHFSASTNRGRANLVEKLTESAAYLRERQGVTTIGVARYRVKTKLEEMRAADAKLARDQRRHRTLTQAEYQQICAEAELETEPQYLLNYLHHVGVVFHPKDAFEDRIILDQSWALDAIYTVFDQTRACEQLRRLGGCFTRSLLEALVWRDHLQRDQELFLDMMLSCGVCFVHREGDPKLGVETEYIAPELLPSRRTIEREIEATWDSDTAIATQIYRYGFLYQGLIRAIIAEIGSDAGVSGLYWRDGLCAFEESMRSRALIEQQMDADGSGRILVQTRGGRAQELLERLCMLVERAQNRIGLEGVRSGTKAPTQEEAASMDAGRSGRTAVQTSGEIARELLECLFTVVDREKIGVDLGRALSGTEVSISKETTFKDSLLTFGAERSAKPKCYISYAWADPTDPDREKIVDQACEEAERRGMMIIRDKATLKLGDSISKFMREIGEGDVIIVVLSDKYLKSPYCMFELFEIWRNSRQDKAEFLSRVRVYTLRGADIWTPIDRVRCAKYWRQQHDELKRAVDEAGLDVLGEDDLRTYKLMQDFASKVGDILALFANIVQPRSFDDLKKYGFDEFCDGGGLG